jgi:multidrug resistance efflux pump
MSNSKSINSTPLRHRLKRARLRFLPFLFFAFVCGACVYLWQFQSQGIVEVGLVEVVSHVVISPGEGKIDRWVSRDGKPLPVNSFVNENDIIAVLDDAPLTSDLATLQRQIAAIGETVSLEIQNSESDQPTPISKAWTSSQGYLSSAGQQADTLMQKLALRSVDLEVMTLKKIAVNPADMERLQKLQIKRAALSTQAASWESSSTEAPVELGDLLAINERQFENTDRLLFLKLRENCQAIEAKLAAAQIAIESLDIISPYRGQVEKSYVQPNENVNSGEPVLALTAVEGSFVVVYARENCGLLPTAGSPVVLGIRGSPDSTTDSVVESVSAKYVSIPTRQRLNPAIEEWGRAMRIRVPDDFSVVPGSLVDVTFSPCRSSRFDQSSTAKK